MTHSPPIDSFFLEMGSFLDQFIRDMELHSKKIQGSPEYYSQVWQNFKTRLKDWKKILARFRKFLSGLPKDIQQKEMVLLFKQQIEASEKRVNEYFSKLNRLQKNYKLSWQEKMQTLKVSMNNLREEALPISTHIGVVRENMQKWVAERKWLSSRHHFQWGRKFFHTANSFFGLWLYVFSGAGDAFVLGVLSAYFALNLSVDILRKKSPRFNEKICHAFSGIMRENERHKISSASWYLGSILAVMLLFPKEIVVLCVLFVTFGDTAAGIVGVHFGKHKIKTHVSVEGSLAGLAACFLSTMMFTAFWLPNFHLSGWPLVEFSLLAGVIGALSETLFKKFDDNLMIPLLSAPSLFVLMKFIHP